MTARCINCRHLHRDTSKTTWTRAWLCSRFKHDATDPANGEKEPPYKRCFDVLRVSTVHAFSPCEFHEPERDAPEMVVSEGAKGRQARLKEVG